MRSTRSITGGRLIAAAAAASTLWCCAAQAGTLFTNGRFITLNEETPEVEAVLVEDGRIVEMGSAREVFGDVNDAIMDMKGAVVLPGLIDAHGHVGGLGGLSAGVLDLSSAESYDEMITLVVDRAATLGKGRWIIGRGWDHESWPGSKALPDHELLSIGVPDHPVALARVDGHALLANRNAMERAGVTAETENPAGGEVIRRPGNEPTGVFVDNAEELINKAIPRTAFASDRELILAGQQACIEAGLTSVHDMGLSPGQIGIYRELVGSGELKLRVYGLINAQNAMRWFESNEPFTGERFSVNGAKLYMDGAMGSRGAWLLSAYSDRPRAADGTPYVGLAVSEPEFIQAVAEHGVSKGYQLCVHAIGDRANREVLDAFEAAFRGAGENPEEGPIGWPHRFRVEHAQLLHPADIRRFATLGVIPSMQPRHATSDMRWVEDRVGSERTRGAYAWQSLIRTGARIASGSDFPVEPVSPLLGYFAAVTRQNEQGQPPAGWYAAQKMDRVQALKSFTIWAAEAEFAEDDKGSIEVGKLADFTVVDTDILECHPMEILKTNVLMTVIGGEVVYRAE